MCSIDAVDTARNPVTSPFLNLLKEVKKKNITPAEVVFAEGAENAKSLFELYTSKRWGRIVPAAQALKEKKARLIVLPRTENILRELKKQGVKYRALKRHIVVLREKKHL